MSETLTRPGKQNYTEESKLQLADAGHPGNDRTLILITGEMDEAEVLVLPSRPGPARPGQEAGRLDT